MVGAQSPRKVLEMVFVRSAVGFLLLAHGLVHLLYLAPGVPEFSLDRSWLVPETARRPLALGLIAATTIAFAMLALAVWGVPGLATAWPTFTVVACVISAVLLVLFWNVSLVFGLAIDIVLLAIAVTRPDWAARFLA